MRDASFEIGGSRGCSGIYQRGRVWVTIPHDELIALVTINAQDMTPEAAESCVRLALAEAGVVYGLMNETIRSIGQNGGGVDVPLAVGDPPEHGRDEWFELLIEVPKAGEPKVLANGRVDYFDLGFSPSVHVGDPLMRRHPGTEGRPGRNVRGERLEARPGRNAGFRRIGRGTAIDYADPDLLIATASGLPRIGPDFVAIERTLHVSQVDLSTGHIRFDGQVIVDGDVADGLQIEATGDVEIRGVADGAQIVAGGNVRVREGVFGHGHGLIRAGGSVSAPLFEQAHVVAGDDILFEEEVRHCDLIAGHDILAISKVGAGQILGGTITAGHRVDVHELGGAAHGTTHVHVPGGEPSKSPDETPMGVRVSQRCHAGVVFDVATCHKEVFDDFDGSLQLLKQGDRVVLTP